ncbi:MAG: restriction endonuclease [Pirellulales bacterium]
MIWEYRDVSDPQQDDLVELFRASMRDFDSGRSGITKCPFCSKSKLLTLSHHSDKTVIEAPKTGWRKGAGDTTRYLAAHACSVCGWWNVIEKVRSSDHVRVEDVVVENTFCAAWGTLKKLDLDDVQTPTDELIQYLLAKYDDRFLVHPEKFERLVADVYSNAGYSVRVTSYSGDDGIDVIVLDGPDDHQIGIQVKRYKGKIEAEPIRSLAGALLLNGLPKGAFVTTSSFTSGARSTADRYFELGMPIELVDAERFFDQLELSRRKIYLDANDPTAPFAQFIVGTTSLPSIFSEQHEFDIGPPNVPEYDSDFDGDYDA